LVNLAYSLRSPTRACEDCPILSTMLPFLKTAPVFLVVIAGFLASAPLVGGGAISTCIEQEPCLKWEVLKLAGDNCDINADSCPVKVCLVLDMEDAECILATGATVSHLCDNANSSGCVRSTPWVGHDGGVDSDDGGSGNCYPDEFISGWDDKCETVPDRVRLCQIGKPGDELYWNV
jgi:hypothetical protein